MADRLIIVMMRRSAIIRHTLYTSMQYNIRQSTTPTASTRAYDQHAYTTHTASHVINHQSYRKDRGIRNGPHMCDCGVECDWVV